MNEGLNKLFEAMAKDESLGNKFSQCKTPEEAYRAATEIVGGYTIEEFKAAMEEVSKHKDAGQELSEADLDSVSGGSGWEMGVKIGIATVGGAVTVGTAAVSASAASM